MAYLHNDKELFQDAIALAYEKNGIMTQAIEKDYSTFFRRYRYYNRYKTFTGTKEKNKTDDYFLGKRTWNEH